MQPLHNHDNGCCFNTQPPKGGWSLSLMRASTFCRFNTQPPKGGWELVEETGLKRKMFQHTAA